MAGASSCRGAGNSMRLSSTQISGGLALCCGLFILRVLGQLVQELHPVAWLPSIEAWQGSSIPYHWLLIFQLLIIGALIYLCRGVKRQSITPNIVRGKALRGFAVVYGGCMLARLIVGSLNISSSAWFHKPIPALFHVLLASALMLFAKYDLEFRK